MGILDGKKVLVTGVLNDSSIAFSIAKNAQEQGAEIILTSFGRVMSLTQRTAKRLPVLPDILELDVSEPAHFEAVGAELASRWGRVDGVVHCLGRAPEACLGGDMMRATWDDVAAAIQVSAYSLKPLAEMAVPLMPEGGSVVGLTFDAATAWPEYNWMGVAKAALESTSRYLARDLGPKKIRVNLVAAGPLSTLAARSIGEGFNKFESVWDDRAPMGWDLKDADPAGKAVVALLSDFFPATTGEIIHVDGGFHAVGA